MEVLNVLELLILKRVILCYVNRTSEKTSQGALAWGEALQGICEGMDSTAPCPGLALGSSWKPTHILSFPHPGGYHYPPHPFFFFSLSALFGLWDLSSQTGIEPVPLAVAA